MASNLLAPAPSNALVGQQDPLTLLLQKSAMHPQYNDLTGYLSSRQMLPPIEMKGVNGGSFTYNAAFSNDLPESGVIRVGHASEPRTLVHELTHAADRQIGWQYFQLRKKTPSDLTPLEKQFLDAYEKLRENFNVKYTDEARHPRRQTAARLAPEWAAANREYRASSSELPAFGMGSTVSSDVYSPAPLHVNPTMATEFSILLDLADRVQKSQPANRKK